MRDDDRDMDADGGPLGGREEPLVCSAETGGGRCFCDRVAHTFVAGKLVVCADVDCAFCAADPWTATPIGTFPSGIFLEEGFMGSVQSEASDGSGMVATGVDGAAFVTRSASDRIPVRGAGATSIRGSETRRDGKRKKR